MIPPDLLHPEERDILENAVVDGERFHIAGMIYQALVMEHEPPDELTRILALFIRAGRVYRYSAESSTEELLVWLETVAPAEARILPPLAALRLRHVVKDQKHYCLMFNEERAPLDFYLDMPVGGPWSWLDPASSPVEQILARQAIDLDGYELKILIGPGKFL